MFPCKTVPQKEVITGASFPCGAKSVLLTMRLWVKAELQLRLLLCNAMQYLKQMFIMYTYHNAEQLGNKAAHSYLRCLNLNLKEQLAAHANRK